MPLTKREMSISLHPLLHIYVIKWAQPLPTCSLAVLNLQILKLCMFLLVVTLENKAVNSSNFKCCGLMKARGPNTRWLYNLMYRRKYRLQRKNTLLFY